MEELGCGLSLFGKLTIDGKMEFTFLDRDERNRPRILEARRCFSSDGWSGLWDGSRQERRTLRSVEGLRLPTGHPELDNFLLTPILRSRGIDGFPGMANKPGGFAQEDELLLESVADQTAPILRAYREEARQIREGERVEERFRQAQKMEALGQLAGWVAHDFNNLLHIIQGHAELALLEEAQLSASVREALEQIGETTERAATLVHRLLTLSRQKISDSRPVDLSELVEDLTRLVKRVIGEHTHLDLRTSPGTGTIRADPGHIEQILLNLCVNARDAMPDGGIITIGVKSGSWRGRKPGPWAFPRLEAS